MNKKVQSIIVNIAIAQVTKFLIGALKDMDPEDFKTMVYNAIDKATDTTPWEWDDKYIDPTLKELFNKDEIDGAILFIFGAILDIVSEQVSPGVLRQSAIQVLLEAQHVFSGEGRQDTTMIASTVQIGQPVSNITVQPVTGGAVSSITATPVVS